ncbi:hypothetical protein JL720_7836 [Aureococcus anophagefferens]|nr:hypothetical protein JL720_7836 [Aureococcus anophagefferens]
MGSLIVLLLALAGADASQQWRVSGGDGPQETVRVDGLEAALAAAAAARAETIVAVAPSASGDAYAASGAAAAVDRFLTTRLEYALAREPFDGGGAVELRYEASAAELAAAWRRHQFGPGSCDAVVTTGQLASSATVGKYGHVGLDALRRGYTIQHPLTIDKWYMAQGSDGFCGDERGRFECLFLPWNRCPTRATVERLDGEAARRGDAKRPTATMLGPSNAYSGRFAVFGSAAASLCDKSTPLFARCPPHSSLCGDPPAPAPRCANVTRAFDLREAEPDERWDSERRLTLLHRALWDRPAWRLRNATAAEAGLLRPRRRSARRAAGRCAFVHIRHGDKLYDRWLRIHKTRSFAVDLPQYVSEALPLLGLLGSERPHEVLLMSTTAAWSPTRPPSPASRASTPPREPRRPAAGPGCQLSFSFGSQEASTAAATNAKLGRTCAQPATPEAVRKYGTGRRTCDPPSPPVPGPTLRSDAALHALLARGPVDEPAVAVEPVAAEPAIQASVEPFPKPAGVPPLVAIAGPPPAPDSRTRGVLDRLAALAPAPAPAPFKIKVPFKRPAPGAAPADDAEPAAAAAEAPTVADETAVAARSARPKKDPGLAASKALKVDNRRATQVYSEDDLWAPRKRRAVAASADEGSRPADI